MARNRAIAVSDCETDPFRVGRLPRPFIWGFYDGLHYMEFYAPHNTKILRCVSGHCGECVGCISTKQYVDYIREQSIICYAHNGGKFDWHFVLPHLTPYDDVMLINNRIARAYIGKCELRDSYNILPVPLKAYKKDEIDYAIMEPEERYKPKNWQKIREYLRSDNVYLHELVSSFVNSYGVQITQASAAMNQWKKISERPLPVTNKEFYDVISPYYYGGRVQCFESGIIDTRFCSIDINSAYPFAMKNRHPYSGSFSIAEGFIDNADFYKIEADASGAFPYRGEGNPEQFAGLRFPLDGKRRVFHVTGWEYRAAVETDTLWNGHVLESVIFDDHIDFGVYIDHFYQLRLQAKQAGNEAESLFAKLLMNSLYGKFASNPEHYRDYIIVPMDVIGGLDAEGYEFAGELGPWGLAARRLREDQERYYNVATGASITGYVRAMLWRAIAKSKGVLYCDTDSIAVREPSPDIVFGDGLGQWKHEGDFDKAGIAGKKLYIFRGVKVKGKRTNKMASKGARLTEDDLWKVAAGGVVEFKSDVPTFSPVKAPFFQARNIRFTAERSK